MKRRRRRLGLALGGGGLLGVAHIGVLEVLEENGILPGIVTGTSAGAFVAALYTAGLEPQTLRSLALKLSWEDLFSWNFTFCSFLRMLLRNLRDLLGSLDVAPLGLLSGSRIAGYVERVTGVKSMARLLNPVGLVATDLASGNRVVFTNLEWLPPAPGTVYVKGAPLGLAVRASTAIPGVFEPVPYRGMLLSDGGLLEIVPAATARLLGAKIVVAVRHDSQKMDREPDSIVQVIMRGLNIMSEKGMKQDLEWSDLTIVTPAINAGLSDFGKIPELLEKGRAAAVKALPELKRLVGM